MRVNNTRSAISELGIIRLLLNDPGLFNNSDKLTVDPNLFSTPIYQKVFLLLWNQHLLGRHPDLTALSGALTQDEMSYIISSLQSDNKSFSTNREQMLEDYIRAIRNESEKRNAQSGHDIDLRAIAEKNKHKKGTGGKQYG